jgi:hypothetical protein
MDEILRRQKTLLRMTAAFRAVEMAAVLRASRWRTRGARVAAEKRRQIRRTL